MSETPEDGAYLLGTDASELARLGLQHRVWAADTTRLWREAGFGPGQVVMDVGCGPGFASVDLAHLVGPRGRVIAVDRSARFLAQLERRAGFEGVAAQVETRALELTGLELEAGSLDGAYGRWVLCFLADPRALLAQLTRAVRPGGRLVLQDYANYGAMKLLPEDPGFAAIAHAIGESWRRQDGDLDVGDRVPGWLTELGWTLHLARPNVQAARPGSPHWAWLTQFFEGYLPRVVEQGLLDAEALERFLATWRTRGEDPGARFLTPPVLEVVAERR